MLRLGIAEIDVFHLALYVVEPQLVSQRNVKHQSLKHFAFTRLGREHAEAAHHLKPVGDLEDSHPGVGGILDDQLFVVFGFEPRILRFDGGDAVKAVYHRVDLIGKTGRTGQAGVHPLRLVQENRGNALRRKPDFVGGDECDAHRMADEWRPVKAGIFAESLFGKRICPADKLLLLRSIMRKFLSYDIHGPGGCYFFAARRAVRARWNSRALVRCSEYVTAKRWVPLNSGLAQKKM